MCDTCDALIEITTKSDQYREQRNCLECAGKLTLVSVGDATIKSTTIEKEAPMETTTGEQYMTREVLESQLVQNKKRIEQLEKDVQLVRQVSNLHSTEKHRIIKEMQEWTLEALDNANLLESDAEEIAKICGFDLTKEFELEVSVQYSITVNTRTENDAINLIHEIDFDTVSEPQGVSYLSSSIERVDVS